MAPKSENESSASKSWLANAPRSSIFSMDPLDPLLCVIGRDYIELYGDEQGAATHALYDERAFWPAERRAHIRHNYAHEEPAYRKAEPIVVWQDGRGEERKLLVVDGRQRLLAAREHNADPLTDPAKYINVWVIRVEVETMRQLFALMLKSNLGATKDDPMTIARKLWRAKKLHGYTTAEITQEFQFSPNKQGRYDLLMGCHPKLQEAVSLGRLKMAAACAVAHLPGPRQLAALAAAEKARERPALALPEGDDADEGSADAAEGSARPRPTSAEGEAPPAMADAPGPQAAAAKSAAPKAEPKPPAKVEAKGKPQAPPRITAKELKRLDDTNQGRERYDQPTLAFWRQLADFTEVGDNVPKGCPPELLIFIQLAAGRAADERVKGMTALRRAFETHKAGGPAPAPRKR